MLCTLLFLSALAADPPLDLCCGSAFGFPQKEADLLCKTDDLKVSVWNNNEYFYVQAVFYTDSDDTLGETEDGREIGDWSSLLIDADGDGEVTPKVDRAYSLNPWPRLPGLHYSVQMGGGASTGLQADSKGRGAIAYPVGRKPGQSEAEAGKVRVDTFLIPLAELNAKPGDTIRFAYCGFSAKPELTVNSVGYTSDTPRYYGHHLPREKWHELKLSDRTTALDEQAVPEGRGSIAITPATPKPMPALGGAPPEISAETWLNASPGETPSLASLKGKVVMVEFWATWCGPCVQAIPHLNELQEKHAADGLVILSITDQSARGIAKFLEKTPMKTIVGCKSSAIEDYGVTGIPHSFLIGRDGLLRWHGSPQGGALDAEIAKALAD
jgi:thiol-disulfide isomerase/thioredoxin